MSMILIQAAALAAAQTLAVTQPSDDALSCEQIAQQGTALQTEIQREEEQTTRRAGQSKLAKSMLGGVARGALSAAPALLGGQLDGLGGYAAQQMIGAAAVPAAQALAEAPAATPAKAKPSPRAERLEHLRSLAAAKGC